MFNAIPISGQFTPVAGTFSGAGFYEAWALMTNGCEGSQTPESERSACC